jgi:hypothetical protein
MRAVTWSFGLMLLLAGCAAMPTVDAPADVNAPLIAPGQLLVLPRPADLGRRILAVQLITAKRGGQTFVFEGHLNVRSDRVTFIGLDSLGRRAVTIAWNGRDVSAEVAPWLPPALRPGSLLADLVVIYWPERSVRAALPPGGELLQEPHSRTIRLAGRDVLHAEYGWRPGGRLDGILRYSNFAWDYQIEVQSSEIRQ